MRGSGWQMAGESGTWSNELQYSSAEDGGRGTSPYPYTILSGDVSAYPSLRLQQCHVCELGSLLSWTMSTASSHSSPYMLTFTQDADATPRTLTTLTARADDRTSKSLIEARAEGQAGSLYICTRSYKRLTHSRCRSSCQVGNSMLHTGYDALP